MSDEARTGLGISIETFGPLDIVFNDTTGELVSGHQRVERLKAAGATEVVRDGDWGHIVHPKTGERFPVRFVAWDETKQRMANLVANNPHLQGDFTDAAIDQVRSLEDEAHFNELQLDKLLAAEEAKLDSDGGDDDTGTGSLASRFGVPPFSVLDARQGVWQDRKRAWVSLGIQSELGRGDCTPGGVVPTHAEIDIPEKSANTERENE